MFDNYEQIKEDQKVRILKAAHFGFKYQMPGLGEVPYMRYMPNRQIMQRMIRRAAALPDHFLHFGFYKNTINSSHAENSRIITD